MAIRNRFTRAERTLFVPGASVEYLHGSTWRPAEVTAAIDVDSIGMQRVRITDRGKKTATASPGQIGYGYPGQTRIASTHSTTRVEQARVAGAQNFGEGGEGVHGAPFGGV